MERDESRTSKKKRWNAGWERCAQTSPGKGKKKKRKRRIEIMGIAWGTCLKPLPVSLSRGEPTASGLLPLPGRMQTRVQILLHTCATRLCRPVVRNQVEKALGAKIKRKRTFANELSSCYCTPSFVHVRRFHLHLPFFWHISLILSAIYNYERKNYYTVSGDGGNWCYLNIGLLIPLHNYYPFTVPLSTQCPDHLALFSPLIRQIVHWFDETHGHG